jgi:hypothetical protein
VSGINCDEVTHQQRQQLEQKLADAGLDLMHLERFIGYASNGQKQMNGNQLHSYLFNSPVQAVSGAADGDPNSPSTYKSGWDVTVSPSNLSTLCPWPWHAIPEVEKAMAQFTDPAEQASLCLIQVGIGHDGFFSLWDWSRRDFCSRVVPRVPIGYRNCLSFTQRGLSNI